MRYDIVLQFTAQIGINVAQFSTIKKNTKFEKVGTNFTQVNKWARPVARARNRYETGRNLLRAKCTHFLPNIRLLNIRRFGRERGRIFGIRYSVKSLFVASLIQSVPHKVNHFPSALQIELTRLIQEVLYYFVILTTINELLIIKDRQRRRIRPAYRRMQARGEIRPPNDYGC